jgi:enoyl-[acyl-carrier protein] reductase III
MSRVAVVTGGTRGIGRAISLRLNADGARVYALYVRDQAAATTLETEASGITCLRGDLRDEERLSHNVERVVEETGRVDVLVHCAAAAVFRDTRELTSRHVEWTYAVNVAGFHSLVRRVLPHMASGGRVVAVSSAGARIALPQYAALGAAKAALESLVRHHAAELAPLGIIANCVSPGTVDTKGLRALPGREARVEAARRRTPSGRLTTPEDVAEVVAFLCSAGAAQIVGQTVVVDGGVALLGGSR